MRRRHVPLAIGMPVRAYRSHAAGTLWLYDPATGTYAEDGWVPEGFVEGVVREIGTTGEVYRVTVTRNGRELFADWRSWWWITRLDEPAPEGWDRVWISGERK